MKLTNNSAFIALQILNTIDTVDFDVNMKIIEAIDILESHIKKVQKASIGLSSEEQTEVGLKENDFDLPKIEIESLRDLKLNTNQLRVITKYLK